VQSNFKALLDPTTNPKEMGMKKNYELVCILDPQLGEKQLEDEVTKYETFLKGKDAEVAHIDRWGMRKLAYSSVAMKRRQQGYYVLFQFTGEAGLLDALHRELKLDEGVLRYQIVAVKGAFLRVPQLPADILLQAREDRPRGPRGPGGPGGRFGSRDAHRAPEVGPSEEGGREDAAAEDGVEETAASEAPAP
jgi:small subunit ribosomal protein S6